VFDALPPKAKINVITFAGDTTPVFAKLQTLGKKQRKQAESFVKALYGKGPTNVHDALEAAFADRDVDTIFLLTDGQPSTGPIVDREALADEVRRWNADRGIRIHTIAIGQKSELLARLAKDSGGEHSVSR
jgi:Mg-chelatase subunit ChlD